MGKEHKKSRREEKEHGTKERERDRAKSSDAFKEREVHKESDKDRRVSGRDRRDDIEDYEKDKHRDKVRDKEYDQRDRYREREKDYKDKGKDEEREREKETVKEHERGRDRKEKEKDREKGRDKVKDREREKQKDREREKVKEKDKDRDRSDREKGKGRDREKEREMDGDNKERPKDKFSGENRDGGHDRLKDDGRDEKGFRDQGHDSTTMEYRQKHEVASGGLQPGTSEIEQRILKMREERLKEKSEGVSEVLAWVSKSRKIEDKMKDEKKKALHLSKVFEEQDNDVLGESEDEEPTKHTTKDLAGVKVLHGLDKVIEGGAVVLTLKDQSILADGDINDEVDMLENVEIGEQKQRDDAYKAAKKKTGIYDDKFSDESSFEKKILPQYDDPIINEGVTLDESGRFTGEAEKKLEELRKRIQGASTKFGFDDLTSSAKLSSDYYTQDEMLQFKKPKKKKSLRKKDKLDLDALEAEAISAGGLGTSADLGSRKDGKRQIAKEEQKRFEAQMKSDAYNTAYAKAEEASKALRQQLPSVDGDDNPVFGDDDDDLYKSLEKARRLALKKQDNNGVLSGPQAVASLARATTQNQPAETETQENKVVFTEMDEFVWGLQLDEDTDKPVSEDIYMDEDEAPKLTVEEIKNEPGGWSEVNDGEKGLSGHVHEEEGTVKDDNNLHEVAVGKGLSGALKLLKERGTLKETIEWGGRNMDKKKSKLVGIHENDGPKEINIERLDEFGRVMTPKEAFRLISHKFHGKGPGKGKLEKRQKQYQEELKLKQMKNSDTPSHSVERMREAQARMHTPYLVLTGNAKPGQSNDPRSGFAEDLPGGLTPMLGDRKVELFLGIKRKPEAGGSSGSMGPPKRQKPN